jgi:hypothetical protein
MEFTTTLFRSLFSKYMVHDKGKRLFCESLICDEEAFCAFIE